MVQYIRPEWTVHENIPITSGTDAVSFIIVETERGRREMILKACTAVTPEDFRPEPYLLSILETKTSVPGPHVLGAVDDHDDLPAPFFLMERCKGALAGDITLTPEMCERMARAAGRFAGEYHTLGDFGRFGRIQLDCDRSNPSAGMTVDGRTLAVADDAAVSWRAFLEDMYEGWIHDLDDEFCDLRTDLEAFIEPRFNTLDRSFDSVLGHIDYKPRNVLVRPETGETTAVLDWGHATAMPPYYDLLLTETHLSRWAPLSSNSRRRIREALAEGYAETNSLERGLQSKQRRELYLAVAHLQPLVWFSKWTEDVSDDERRQRAAKHREFYGELLR